MLSSAIGREMEEKLLEKERPLLKEIILCVLKESAQSALSLSVLVDMQYKEFKKFIAKLRTGSASLSTKEYTSPVNKLHEKYHKIGGIYYVFLNKGTINEDLNCSFATETAGIDDVVYCALLTNGEFTNETFEELMNNTWENHFKHELTHIYDNQDYRQKNGNKPVNIADIEDPDYYKKYHNHGLEFHAHENEIINNINKYINQHTKNYSLKEQVRIYNEIVKHLNDFRIDPDPNQKSELLSIDLIIFLYRLTKTNYRKLLTDIGEYIYYIFEEKRKEIDVNKKEND